MYKQVTTEDTHTSTNDITHNIRIPRFFDAIKQGNVDVVHQFLDHIPECVDWIDVDGHTALNYAALNESMNICELLLENGADPHLESQDLTALLFLAIRNNNPKTVGLLMEHKVDPNLKDADGYTALHYTSSNESRSSICELLLANGADPNIQSQELSTPLVLAVKDNNVDIVRLLLEHKADANLKNTDGYTALHYAVLNESMNICELLLENGADPHLESQDLTALLFLAIRNNNPKTVGLLMEHKVDPNLKDADGYTALHYTSSNESRSSICELLLANGADPNIQSQNGYTALHYAAWNDITSICEFLLANAANPNIQSKELSTPLVLAVKDNNVDIVRLLLEHKADANLKNTDGYTALHYAALNESMNICELLLENGADPHLESQDLTALFFLAIRNNNPKTVGLLMEHKVDPNLKDADLSTPLIIAVQNNNMDIVRLLIEHKADSNLKNTDGYTALHYAALIESMSICEFLLANAADPNLQSKDLSTPLVLAAQNNNVNIVSLLLKHKADSNLKNTICQAPLHDASAKGNKEMCRLLLDSSTTDPNIQDLEQKTPLHYACVINSVEICQMLLDRGSNPNYVDEEKKTPLHYACAINSVEICQMLLDRGSNPKYVDEDGNTPLHVAAKQMPGLLELQVLLVERGATLTATNQFGETPKSLAKWEQGEETLITRAEQRQQYSKLLSQGNKPIETVKLFFCGNPRAGKTSLRKSLVSKAKEDTDSNSTYDSTPGIDVVTERIPKAGVFSLWDCSGQVEYHVTHGMFMGVDNSIFTVTYDLSDSAKLKWTSVKYWLSFIRAGHSSRQKSKPQIVVIASHLDKCRDKESAFRDAERLLKNAKDMFSKYLDISSDLVVVDARLPTGLDLLKENLKKTSEEIKGTKTVPMLCGKIKSVKTAWGRDDYPVLGWSEFYQKVKEDIDPLVTEDFLKIATLYLHDMGEVYFAELQGREHQVILNTKWFSYDIIGAAFAGDDFPVNFTKLPECYVYTRTQLLEFFKTSADIDLLVALLQHVGLLHKCGRDKYIIPGKLPETLDKVSWRKEEEFKEYHGRRLKCREEVDIFAPDVFPCIQTCIMEEMNMIDEAASISRTTLKFSADSVEGMIQLSCDKRGISVACRCRGEEDRGACHSILDKVTRLVKLEIIKRSPGTQTEMFYLSPRALYAHDDLADVWYYSEDAIKKAGQDGKDSVTDSATGNNDKISSILCMGYDPLFLQVFGAKCSVQWVPHSVKKELYRCLDVQNPRRDDYRSLAEVLGIPAVEVEDIEKERSASFTHAVIARFCDRVGEKMSLNLLHDILSHPGLVDNNDALRILEELLSESSIEVPEISSDIIPTDMSIDHIAWRATLRQCWETLRSDIKPSALEHPFLSEDDEDLILAEERLYGKRRASKLLLARLLQTQGWYTKFLESLRIAGADHLVQLLKETHEGFMKTMPMVKMVREGYQKAWSQVMKMKKTWLMFRSKIVPSTVVQHLPFLSEEDKNTIRDAEQQIGSASAAADVLHSVVRDSSDPDCYKILFSCLRDNGYDELAQNLCDELKSVLASQEFKFISVHVKAVFPL